MVGVHLGDIGIASTVYRIIAFHDSAIKDQNGILSQGRFEESIVGGVKSHDSSVEGISYGITVAEGRCE